MRRFWPCHTLTPNLLTDCFLDPKRQRLPPSVLAELYVAVPRPGAPAAASHTRQARSKETIPKAKAPEAGKPATVQAAKPSVQRITGIAELQALGLHALEQELQRRGLKSGGTLLQRAQRLAAIGGLRVEPAPAASATAPKPAAAPRMEAAGKRKREPKEVVQPSSADEFADAIRRDPPAQPAAVAKARAPKGSGGPALRAPDPNSKRSRMKASTGSSGWDAGGGWGTARAGDWSCPGCGANVFANKASCFKCGHTRPGGAQREQGGGAGGRKEGDWTCTSCGVNVFASKARCFKCGAPKGGGGKPAAAARNKSPGGAHKAKGWR